MGTKRNQRHNAAPQPNGEVYTAQFVEEYQGSEGVPTRPLDVSDYEVALSRVVASEMQENADVDAFRSQWLPEGVMRWDRVEEWLRRQTQNRPPGVVEETRFTVVGYVIPEKWDGVTPVPVQVPPEEALRGRSREVRYLVPPAQRTRKEQDSGYAERQWPVSGGTALVPLSQFSADIPKRIPWSEAQTSVFLLTGLTPLIRQVRVGDGIFNPDWPALNRMELFIDPRITHRELAEAYQAERLRGSTASRHHRDLSAKGLALAVFGTLPEGHDGTLAERMAQWNAAHPDWGYDRIDNFSRDLGRARRRLLGITWPTRAPRSQRRIEDTASADGED